MTVEQYTRDDREIVWLTVDYLPAVGTWLIDTTYPPFIDRKLAKEFVAIEGNSIVYMVRGFDNYSDAKAFANTYHKAKKDGFVHRYRLD